MAIISSLYKAYKAHSGVQQDLEQHPSQRRRSLTLNECCSTECANQNVS